MKPSLVVAGVLLALPNFAAAQSRGTITDSRLIVQRSNLPPDTSLVRGYSVGGKFRSEHVGGRRTMTAFGDTLATVDLMILSDSGMTMISMDTVTKTYSIFEPGGVMKGAMEMLKSMGSEMKTRMTADSVSFDSLGDGGVIAGHRTIHFRSRFTAQMSMSMMGQSMSMSMTDSMDTYVAPDLRDESDSFARQKTAAEMKRFLGGLIQFDFGDIITRLAGSSVRIAKAGMPLKTVNSITTTAMGMTNAVRMTTEVLKFERAVLPDSLFQVPAGYKKVDPMIRFPHDTTGTSTSGSLRTPF